MKKKYSEFRFFAGVLALAMLSFSSVFAQTVVTLGYTGGVQTFTVPSCVGSITVDAKGAQGGSNGGLGGRVQNVYTVTPGDVLYIYVGGQGAPMGIAAAGGFNGGGNAGTSTGATYAGSGGGGATDIRVNSTALSSRIIVAGGGGGVNNVNGNPGAGGGLTGGNVLTTGNTCIGTYATGGSQTAGGNACTWSGSCCPFTPSSILAGLGVGGDGSGPSSSCNSGDAGAGGGGGYYGGGGGGTYSSGGGGSSYTGPGATNVTHTQGYQTGNGSITFTYNTTGAGISVNASSNPICAGSTVSLTATSMVSYTWLPVGTFTGSNTYSITHLPSGNTSYTVYGLNPSGCTSTFVTNLIVQTGVPSLTLVNTANSGGICPTKTVMLTASGANTYTWSGGSTAVTNGVAFAPMTAADYTVKGGNACGTTTAATSVSVHPLPNITPVASTSSLCSGGSVTLTGTGNSTNYVWSGFTSPISDGVGFFPLVTATYSVIGTSALSCTALATIPVTVVTTPVLAPVAQPVYICLGGSSTLTASGATNYTWTSATQTVYTNTMVTTPSNTGSETFTVTKANANCVDTKMITVVTHALPVVFAIATPTLVCALNTSTLAVAGGQTYTWTAPNGNSFFGASPVVTPSATIVYTVAAHDGTCVNTTTVMVATNPNPTISIVATNSNICQGQSVTMTANGSNSYTWTSVSGTLFTNPITQTPTTSIAYTAKGINNFGCTSTAMQIIVVNPSPTISVNVVKPLVCSGGLSTLTASGANTYTWDANAGSAISKSVAVTSTNTISGPVIYTVVGTNTNTGCQSSKTVQVNVFVPVLTVTGNTNTCEGGNITLTGSGGNNGSYSWNTGNGTSPGSSITRSLSAPAVFTLTAMTNSAAIVCPASKTVALGIYSNPTITAIAQRTTICRGETVELHGEGGVSYSWSNGGAQPTITVGPVNQVQTLSYTVTGTDANGCVNTGTVQVKVSGCTGISEANMSANTGLQVYPNPNNGQFVIETSADMNLVLSNELGQIIRTLVLSGANNHKISVSDLAQGIYFISGQGINQKIVVTK